MLNENYTAKILDLEDVIVTNVEKNDFELHIYLELPRRKHSCPQCGYETDSVHDYREQLVKDLPLGKNTLLHLRKRRYRCKKCHKRFYEQNSFLPRYHRLTNRLAADIICSFSKLQSAKEIAQTHNVSNSTAIRYFDLVSHQCSAMPRVLSIDEFKGNAGGERYQSILADPEKRQIVDILPNRFEGSLIQYFRSFPSQIGAYKILENAIKSCPAGYSVFDDAGKAVYSNVVDPLDNPSPWAREACGKAVEKGIFSGVGKDENGNTKFNWQDPLTREQMAVILDKLNML